MPQVSLNSQATYQSDVTKLSLDMSALPFYFGILAIEKQLSLLDLAKKNLMSSKNITQSMFDNGTAMPGYIINPVNVELLNINKKKVEQNELQELIRKKDEILQLRTQIKEQSESKYSDGEA